MKDWAEEWFPPDCTDRLERGALLLAGLAITSCLVSIFLAQIFLTASCAVSLILWTRSGRPGPVWNSMGLPALTFLGWTLLTALTAEEVVKNLAITRKFLWFLLVFLIPWLLRGRGRVLRVYLALFAVSGISSLLGLLQYVADPQRDWMHRITGFMGQWMTYSGLQMLVLVSLLAYALQVGWTRKRWILPLAALLLISLILSQTRNAWLGTVTGAGLLLALRRPKALGLLIAGLLVFYVAAPAGIGERIRSGWDPADTTTRGRIELMQTAVRLIRDHPWIGVGPKSVGSRSLAYRGTTEFPDWMYQHMHNNFLQIASERGLPGLLLWLWFMGQLARGAVGLYRAGRHRAHLTDDPMHDEMMITATAAMGCWVALLVAGIFEYNFGDSEILALFLFIATAPLALSKQGAPDAGDSCH